MTRDDLDNPVEELTVQAFGSHVWRRSSHSGTQGNCVEAAAHVPGVAVRDSKEPDGTRLMFTAAAWRQFIGCLKADL